MIGRRAQVPLAGVAREAAALRDAILPAVTHVLEAGRFILGPEVQAFENEIAASVGGALVVSCANGTDALILALRALDIGPGHEVIVPAFTFAATAEAVVLVGATPVFADIEPDTFALDPRSARTLVGPRTRAIIAVHLFGQCARMEPLWELAERSSLRIIEDAAQAIGASWRGKAAGALGHLAAFSFYPTKNLGAAGDAGMVTTPDPALADRVRILRRHGSRTAHVHEAVGLNSRLDEVQAAILRVKLSYLDEWNRKRRANAARYREALRGSEVTAPVEIEGAHHVYHHFTVRAPKRERLMSHLDGADIASAIYYPSPLHEQPIYARWARGPLPEAERAAKEVVSVPVHPWLTDGEVARVAEALSATR